MVPVSPASASTLPVSSDAHKLLPSRAPVARLVSFHSRSSKAAKARASMGAVASLCLVAARPRCRGQGCKAQRLSEQARTEHVSCNDDCQVEIVHIGGGKGFGLRSPNGAHAGDILIDEEPLFSRPPGQAPSDIVELCNRLPAERRAHLLNMAATEGDTMREAGFHGEDLTLLRAVRSNSVALPGGGGAVYRKSCRANHSCKPNAALCVGEDNRMRLTAIRDILPGEEVLVSYIGEGDLLKPQAHRQQLISSWGFRCTCERCVGLDDTRGFKCISCGKGILNCQPSASSGTRWGPCDKCQSVLPAETLEGIEQEWVQHVSALKPGPLRNTMALAMYEGLTSSLAESPASGPAADAHWVSAKLAGIAAEELIRRGDGEAAVKAGRVLRRYVRHTLGPVAARATAQVTCIEADAAILQGQRARAEELYQAALREASLLPRSADKLIADIRAKLQTLQEDLKDSLLDDSTEHTSSSVEEPSDVAELVAASRG
eukprot:TRINITY_DN49278_c0_g1_i1.p1 TRINITY_DN49278_c0_g1~~TRINITY_DN49278_c0_g1_i1.p1  ORF type:complete len:502 (+),score=104.85 TRINITY_DN49278_c0_g1_i1:41-1507(+)